MDEKQFPSSKTTSLTDLSPHNMQPPPDYARLISRFKQPKIRRNGKLILYKGRTSWKVGDVGQLIEFDEGKITAEITFRGSRPRVDRGRIEVFNRPNDQKVVGLFISGK
jgi:hypothetical protein